ncbi:SdiA-regulated domain-containing protein [Imtechella halotolerans]|uniref:Lipoprotein n=1 Tax=Imtechella halotolerans K1 TaxID=946077 RepID=I0WJ53_9FLAO|nr:SdiA-regulated domain-containing protein [Imtechella halotolerans]EID76419.1 hypothetical protein W5A_00310 [Imtechella halotolerans K1]WMQ63008.1 SdiA-regulated domain-containing protein [Imtechella halotolerans]
MRSGKEYIIGGFISLLVGTFGCTSQEELRKVFSFPSQMKEVSGVTYDAKRSMLWAIEDSGNRNEVYGIDTLGTVVKTIAVNGVENNDWEALTMGADGSLYVGDFGNNGNTRKNLAIYALNPESLYENNAEVAYKVSFYYPEQRTFPPEKTEKFYDAEAFFLVGDHFYLITKNRSKGFGGTARVYKIPNREGNHAALLLGELETCERFSYCAITDAAISPDGTRIVLLSQKFVWIFDHFSEHNFLHLANRKIELPGMTQRESITFKDANTVWIADERDKHTGGKVYEFLLTP